ncbi:hypothetical protein REPUB_Repub13aG0212600 [Reevesia pubescens]
MDSTDLQKLPLLKLTRNTSSNLVDDPEIEDNEPCYTSMKDLILSSSSSSILPYGRSSINQEGNNELDSSKISIRNRLVKSAASAYLQSAVILVNKDENCLLNLWGKLKNNDYFRDPLEACFRPIYQFFAYTIGSAWGRIFG